MERAYGNLDWWPGQNAFEVAVGAILTQRTSWRNVENAVSNLRSRRVLSPDGISTLDIRDLEQAVKPSGFYKQKAVYLRSFASFVMERYSGRIEGMAGRRMNVVREELLSLPGIGPETADCILLYALGRPSFVVDVYTLRLLGHLGMSCETDYDEVKLRFERALQGNVDKLSRMHALIVTHCKTTCASTPRCERCPLGENCLSNLENQQKEISHNC